MWAGETYIFNKLKNVTSKENIGFYRDDGFGIFQIVPKTKLERKKKQVVKICSLFVAIKRNSKSVDFLNATFDLVNDIYKPSRKPNNKPLYVIKY